jgi:hypothetical protein
MAGFGDSNDIKITVTVDSGPAINAALDIGEAFASIAKNIGVDFKTIAKATSNLAKVQVAEAKASAAEQVATIRATSAEKIEGIKKDVAEFKEGEITKRSQLEATSEKTIQALKTASNAYKQSQVTKRTELITAHKEELQKLKDSADATKLFEVSKRDAAKTSVAQTIAGLKAETSAAKQASVERIAGLKAASEALKAETSKEVRIFKESEATKRAEAKKTVEQLRLDAAKVRQATAAAQTQGAGKGGVGVDLPSLASGVFLFKEAIGLVNSLKNAVISLAEEGNRVQALATAFSTLQQSVGRDPAGSIERLRTATQGLISDTQLYQKANQAVLLQVPTQLFEESAEAAVKLGRAMGIDATFALESLSIGLGRQSRLYLDNLGIVVSATQAYSNFARENNKLVDDLTDAEKRLAFFNETSRKLKDGLATLPPLGRDVGIAFTELKTTTENISDQFLLGFNNSIDLERGFTKLNDAAKPLGGIFRSAGEGLAAFIGKIITADYIPIIDEMALGLRFLGAAAAGAANDFFNLTRSAKVERIDELSAKIANAKASLAVTKSPQARAGLLFNIEQLEQEKAQVIAAINDIDSRKRAADAFKINAKIDTSGITDAITETESGFEQLKKKTEESLGLVRIPGLNVEALDAVIPKIDEVFARIEKGQAGTAQNAANEVVNLAKEVGEQVKQANIEITRKALAAEQEAQSFALAQSLDSTSKITQQEQASTEARTLKIRQLQEELKLQEQSAALDEKQREQLLKLLDERKSRVKKQIAEETKASRNAGRQSKKLADQQEKQLEDLTKGLNRALRIAIPPDVQRKLIDVFNDPQKDADELAKKIREIGAAFLKSGGDFKAFEKEVKDLNDLKLEFPDLKLTGSAQQSEDAIKRIQELRQAQQGIPNIKELFAGEGTSNGAFFGFDLGESFNDATEAELANQIQNFLGTALQAGVDGFAREDVPQIAAGLGALIGGGLAAYFSGGDPTITAAGAQAGAFIGNAFAPLLEAFGQDINGTRQRKQIDKYFSDLFDGGRLGIVIQGQVRTAVVNGFAGLGEVVNEVKPQIQRISDIVFEGFTPFAGLVEFGGEGFFNYFNTLSAELQNSFNGIGLAIGKLRGISTEEARLIGVALANNIGGNLQNLQVLVQATGESFEDLGNAIIKAFLEAQISIEEAYNALLQLQNISEKGIPGAFGAWKEALNNFETALRENQPGRYILDSFRDIASEGDEAGQSFEAIGTRVAQSLGLSGEQVALFFQIMRSEGITNLEQLENASDTKLISILAKAKQIKDGIVTTAEEIAKLPILPEPSKPSTSGRSRGKSAAEIAKDLLKQQTEEARKLTQESQEYLKIIEKINAGQISNVRAGKEIKQINAEILKLIKDRDATEKKLNAELDKGTKGNAKTIAELSAALEKLEKRLDKVKEKAAENKREYKDLNISAVIPLIRSQNTLGLVARQIGVNLKTNVDILVKGFLQGRMSIKQVNDEINKTKELLGPGIPNSVGAVTEAFQNLIDAGRQGGQFSAEAFTDIFAEFREKFVKEGSAFQQAQRKILNDNLDSARRALLTASGPEATEAARKALDLARKAIEDFKNTPVAPDLSDLRDQLRNSFSPEQVDLFFQALDESGLKSFEELEGASAEAIVGILGRLDELGFKFGTTSEEAKGVNKELRDAEIAANGGLDPLQQAINLVTSFNNAAGLLPPVFNSTTDAIGGMEQPLGKIKDKIADTIELLGRLGGQTFTNDIVFNIRTTGEQGGKGLVDLVFGDGSDASSGTGNGKKTPPKKETPTKSKPSSSYTEKDFKYLSPGLYRNLKTKERVTRSERDALIAGN